MKIDSPVISIDGVPWMVRRFMKAAELRGNPFPLLVTNTCGDPRCLSHLEVVTPRELQKDDPTTCSKGHRLTEKNVLWRVKGPRAFRVCKECRADQRRRSRERKKWAATTSSKSF